MTHFNTHLVEQIKLEYFFSLYSGSALMPSVSSIIDYSGSVVLRLQLCK